MGVIDLATPPLWQRTRACQWWCAGGEWTHGTDHRAEQLAVLVGDGRWRDSFHPFMLANAETACVVHGWESVASETRPTVE